MATSSLETAKPHFAPFFNASGRSVWTLPELENVLIQMREEWGLAQRITIEDFIEYLLRETALVGIAMTFPTRPIVRYWWGKPTPYELASSLYIKGYYSHHSAMYLNGLTETEPNTIYVNIEQQVKGARPGLLRQGSIDSAFAKKVRITNNRAKYNDREICIVNGKNTGQFGVVGRKHSEHGLLRLTNPARTLVDCAVRPAYCGGLHDVLRAYRLAASKTTGKKS